MRRLLETVRLWRDGKYVARANVQGGASEIREFGTAFNIMAENIQSRDQQLAAANRAKDIIIATAGHDLRQPLQSITMALTVFSRRRLNETEQRYLDHADQAIDRLVQGLDTLIETTRVHYGALQPQLEPVALDRLFQEIRRQWSARASEKGLRLRVRPSSATVVSDERMLLTILHNLVGNAVKYTDQGGVLVGYRRRANEAWVEVYDSGSGIPADKIETIFGEFQQLHPLTEGFGLGLWIARNTSDALGHQISIRSIVGKGCRFRIIIPTPARSRAITSAL
jgi:signal transduction histidine kinase